MQTTVLRLSIQKKAINTVITMKKITLQKTSYLGKDELKSIIGGYVLFENCECVLKKKIVMAKK